MNNAMDSSHNDFYAQSYDESVPDWPGEIDFYQSYASQARLAGFGLLEVACGTGRVAIRLAQSGTPTVGLDLSEKMLAVARQKSQEMPHIRWIQADMRDFNIGEVFGVVIIPGHSFQNLNTPQDQLSCLACIHRHLMPGGLLVMHLDHQDFSWLGSLVGDKAGIFEPEEEFIHARSGQHIRASRAWTYEPATQTAVCITAWEVIDDNHQVIDRWQKAPVRLHCVFRFEMEHLLPRAGFDIVATYGDFYRQPLTDTSNSMIWVACKQLDQKS